MGKKRFSFKKAGKAILEILGELVLTVVFFGVGAGILAMLGNENVLETVDPDLLILLGILAVFAVFGIFGAIVAVVRKRKKSTA